MSTKETLLNETIVSLERAQSFDANDLVQANRLGEASFDGAVEPAQKVIALFKQLPRSVLDYLPETELNLVKTQANSIYQMFQEILSFDVNEGDVRNRQLAALSRLESAYQTYFSKLYPLISYSMARTVDFNQLEEQGRAAVQSITDQTDKLMTEIEEQKETASSILDEVRKTAAERGITQEATYFKDEADLHRAEANKWRRYTVIMAVAVGLYGLASLFFHKIPWFNPTNTYEVVQFTVGKTLVFFVLAYMLALCSKNFLSNRHNEIVNRHRQNALMTYKSLVAAGGTPEARDVILSHAASSVYKLHDTGYTKTSDNGSSTSSSIVEMLPRTSMPLSP